MRRATPPNPPAASRGEPHEENARRFVTTAFRTFKAAGVRVIVMAEKNTKGSP
jgi:hypothetical protein